MAHHYEKMRALITEHEEQQRRTFVDSSSVDDAAASSPSPNITGKKPVSCAACGSNKHATSYCQQNNEAMGGQTVNGVPCPNCQALGPHICPAHDGLRWAQQDELNVAHRRAADKYEYRIRVLESSAERHDTLINSMQIQINALKDATPPAPTPPTDDPDLREILNALLSTDTNIMGSIDNLAKTLQSVWGL